MKQGIHPNYVECTVRCTCGNTFKTRSTKPELVIDLCDKCHPFYTGQQKLVDTGGRVQRFANKFGGAAQARLDAERPPRPPRPRPRSSGSCSCGALARPRLPRRPACR